jgi:hypothetical protein
LEVWVCPEADLCAITNFIQECPKPCAWGFSSLKRDKSQIEKAFKPGGSRFPTFEGDGKEGLTGR